jgi:hypothetical protein
MCLEFETRATSDQTGREQKSTGRLSLGVKRFSKIW